MRFIMVEVVAALIWDSENRFMICQRPKHKTRALQWEFVGGKAEPGETLQQALMRECAEELAINGRNAGSYYIRGSLTDIQYSNINTQFVGIGYNQVGRLVYRPNRLCRSTTHSLYETP